MESPESQADRPKESSSKNESEDTGRFQIPLSRKMREIVRRLRNEHGFKAKASKSVTIGNEVTSRELAVEIARSYPDIAGGRLEKTVHSIEEVSNTYPIDDWIDKIIALLNSKIVSELDGRLAIMGICELDQQLAEGLETLIPEFRDLIKQEIEKENGYEYEQIFADGPFAHRTYSEDPSVLHLDTAAENDHLGRDGFVEALALWLNRIWHKSNPEGRRGQQNSFMVHLHGAWGSGKTTLLNILEKKLKESVPSKNGRWVVVNFNAWQQSHIQPVWWPLLNQIYKEARKQLKQTGSYSESCRMWWYDFGWKLFSGNKTIGLSFIILLIVTGILILFLPSEQTFNNIAKMVTSVGTVLAGGIYLFRSMFWGSAESADHFIKLTQDPLERIKSYFRKLVNFIDRPIIVFIDDLDRCEAPFVVRLLEEIQTLFNDSRIFYLLAADRRWLYGSFEEEYSDFKKHIDEPGKRLGYLFLDKIFQLSVSVPQVSRETQEAYLNYLYLGENRYTSEDIESIRSEARGEFERTASESELIDKAGERTGDEVRDQIRREEAVRASASKEIETSTEFFLKDFAHLLEPNPRSIKRLVNNYGIHRAMVILSDLELIDSLEKRKKFAIWNILNMRWPLLVEYVEDNPTELEAVLNGRKEEIENEEIRRLIDKPGVIQVLHRNEMGVKLDVTYVNRMLNLDTKSLY